MESALRVSGNVIVNNDPTNKTNSYSHRGMKNLYGTCFEIIGVHPSSLLAVQSPDHTDTKLRTSKVMSYVNTRKDAMAATAPNIDNAHPT